MNSTRLAEEVFGRIAGRLEERKLDIESLVRQGYSFEEWLNWEAFLACDAVKPWNTAGRPRYLHFGVENCQDYADLSVGVSDSRVIAEVGHILDGTSSKWIAKLEHDKLKLARVNAGPTIATLHVIVLASSNPDKPVAWLPKLGCWRCATHLERTIRFDGGSQMIIRGWSRSG
jgi:hypothetical protein